MEIALIHKDTLILGPMGFNVLMINFELEDLEVDGKVTPQSYTDLPIHFSDGHTHLLPIESIIEEKNPKYYRLGNVEWEIVKENDIPIKVKFTYPAVDRTLDEVKEERRREIAPIRREKENTTINLIVKNTEIQVLTSREERILLASKLAASPGPHNYKFQNAWLEITTEELQYILNEIDKVVQSAFDWELSKLQEIDSCETIDDVYDVVIREQLQQPLM